MVILNDLMAFLDHLMGDVGYKDPHMPNGLQVRGTEEVKVLTPPASAPACACLRRPLPVMPTGWMETSVVFSTLWRVDPSRRMAGRDMPGCLGRSSTPVMCGPAKKRTTRTRFLSRPACIERCEGVS